MFLNEENVKAGQAELILSDSLLLDLYINVVLPAVTK
jgi:hypothetical protein